MRGSRLAVLTAGLLVLGGVSACGGEQAAAAAERHVVEMRSFAFEPAQVEVSVGDTIVWENADAVPHTATSASGTWDSGSIAAEGGWEMVATREMAGDYLCTFHPTMTGTIVVR